MREKASVPGATAPLTQQTGKHIPYQPPPPPQPRVQEDEVQPSAAAKKSTSEFKAGIKTLSSFIDVQKTLQLPPKDMNTSGVYDTSTTPDPCARQSPPTHSTASHKPQGDTRSSSYPYHAKAKAPRYTSCNGPSPLPPQRPCSSRTWPNTSCGASTANHTRP